MTASEASAAMERIRDLESKVHELSFLNETGKLLTATLDLDSVLRSLMTQVRDYFQAEAVSVALLDAEHRELVFRVAVGEASEAVTGLRLPLDTGIAGWVTREGKTVCISDVYSDPRFYAGVDEKTAFQTEAVVAVPIQTDGDTIGAIEALNPSAVELDERAVSVLRRVADQAALAITNAELYERARQAELRYERLFHGSPVPIYVIDSDAHILDVNEKGAELLGRTQEDIIGSTWHDVINNEPPSAGSHLEDLSAAGETGQEITVPTPGGPRTLRIHATTTDYGGQRALQWIGHDVTELVALEQARDDLMHMIVHDLQNPLSNIVGSLQMTTRALSEGDTALPVIEVLQVALRSSHRLQRLIDSLLDLRQLEEGKADLDLTLVRPTLLVQEALDIVAPVIEKKNHSLSLDIPPDLPPVTVDYDMITRVLTNLLSNATKYTQSGGKIELIISKKATDVLFTVSDNGPGISPDAQSHIFERFTRLEGSRRTKGTGLGLPFCKLAVEAHGGEIWVDSTPGEGSQFTFRLSLEEQ